MRWYIKQNVPELKGNNYTIMLNGEAAAGVRALETGPEGWVLAICKDGHFGTPGEKHLVPGTDEICQVVRHGDVRVLTAEGVDVSDEDFTRRPPVVSSER